jgi:hypothetical protein
MHRILPRLLFATALLAGAFRVGAADEPALPAQFDLPVMKTSIYVGSVTLSTGAFTLSEDAYSATYEANVFPWTFWGESGTVTLAVNPGDYARLLAGETIEITGEARNAKGKTREVSARAQPADATSGKIKVRISAGGTKLIFNGTYQVTE